MHTRRFQTVLFALIWLCFASLRAGAQSPPDSLCATVNTDGSVQLTWAIPDDIGAFDNFKIFRSLGAGFVEINTVGSSQNSYLDGPVNANTQSARYRIKTVGASESEPSDVVATIYLQLTSSDLGSVAQLSWNAPHTPMPSGGEYIVERQVGTEPFAALATLPPTATSISDTLHAMCDVARTIQYRVLWQGPDCTSLSNTASGEFQDLLGPPVPIVETITTDPQTDDVTVYWHPVQSPDLEQYVVQDIDIGAQTYIDVGFVPAGAPTEYTYTAAPGDESTTFGVRAEDQCGNEQNFNHTYTTMFAEAFYTECELEALVAWSAYEGWPEGVDQYVIHAFVDGTDQVMGTADSASLFFSAEVEPNREYCFYVEAISKGSQRPSTSNGACVNTIYPPIPDHFDIRTVTVVGDAIRVELSQDPTAEGITYELYRAVDQAPFRLITTLDATTAPVMTYTDTDVDVDAGIYTYYFKAVDGCGNTLGETNRGRNIVLRAVADSITVSNYLSWNPYAEWESGVDRYLMLRRLGSEETFSARAVLDAHQVEFEENVEDYRLEEGLFCYRVEALKSADDSSVVSRSNTVCLTQPPAVWIPNAMVVGGHNDVFKPVAGFIDFSSFRMEIYNKWGNRVFHTDDIDNGWDGTYRGDAVREDYFRYIITYRDGAGKPHTAEGALFVLKQQ